MIDNEIVTINDANVVIDVLELDIAEKFFSLNIRFHMTSEVYEEIRYSYPSLEAFVSSGVLSIDTINNFDLFYSVKKEKRQLSDADCTALVLASELNGILLTSDNNLRKTAGKHNISIGGHLWIFKQLVDANILSPTEAITLLDRLNIINPKLGLPQKDKENLIAEWRTKISVSQQYQNQ